eukprot:TRINITY_DN8879_c0_g1_i1.p1 TRINITY_DN8879_c0_g1~~TRINITY_DN8879_c0_g1_i1.p1  ORF type:complete len:222 (+),score=31.94 TRINITY_DN8879_c0_g1_i1:523-1188(+)
MVWMLLHFVSAHHAADQLVSLGVADQIANARLPNVPDDGQLKPHQLSRLQDILTSQMSEGSKRLLADLVAHWGRVAANRAWNGMSASRLTDCVYIYLFPYEAQYAQAAMAEQRVTAQLERAIDTGICDEAVDHREFPQDRLWQLLHRMILDASEHKRPQPGQLQRLSPATSKPRLPKAAPVGALGPSSYTTGAGYKVSTGVNEKNGRGKCRGCVTGKCIIT